MMRSLLFLTVFVITSCGGGGSSSDSGSTTSNTNSPITNNSPITISAQNASRLAGAYGLELLDGAQTVESVRDIFGSLMPELNLQNISSEESPCEGGGRVNVSVRANGAEIVQDYRNCRISELVTFQIDGRIEINVSNLNESEGTFTLSVRYQNFAAGESGSEIVSDGITVFDIDLNNYPVVAVELTSDRRITDRVQNDFFVTNGFRASMSYSAFDIFQLNATEASGEFNYNDEGVIDLSFTDGAAELLGANSTPIKITMVNGRLVYEFDDPAGEPLGLNAALSEVFSVEFDQSNSAPVVSQIEDILILSSEAAAGFEFDISTAFFDADADMLRVDYEIVSMPSSAQATITQENYFNVEFTSNEIGSYVIRATATDPEGLNASNTFTIFVESDTDSDGLADRLDSDDDNDGFVDEEDAFPLDASEWLDTDLDGVGNNSDLDDDADGVIDTEDAFPVDATCSAPSEGENGRCYSELAAQYDAIAVDDRGDVYFLVSANKRIYRWSVESENYIAPLALGAITVSTAEPTSIMYSPTHERIYVGYDNGAVAYYSALNPTSEIQLTVTAHPVAGLAHSGNFVSVAHPNNSGHSIVAEDGAILSSGWGAADSRAYDWSVKDHRLYFFRDGTSPNDLLYRTIDQTTGEVTESGDTPYHGDYIIAPPILVIDDLDLVITGSGDVYSAPELSWQRSIPSDIRSMLWDVVDGLIVIRAFEQGGEIVRRDENFKVLEELTLTGDPRVIFQVEQSYKIISIQNERVFVSSYAPSSDSDGDGVDNNIDDFPLDPAASVDSDLDGYPDSWNSGYAQEDSTMGLMLDSVPNDSICYLPEHSDNGQCDYTEVVKALTPTVSISANNQIFMLSPELNRVFRWSMVSQSYLPALVTGSASMMVYSEAHNRLYLSYANGEVTFISLAGGDFSEQSFTTLPQEPHGLAAVGDFILLADPSGAWNTHYVYSQSGELMDSEDWNYRSDAYAWNETLSRVYFLRNGTVPNDLHFEEIDQITGEITDSGETPGHGDYRFSSPIVLSPNDQLVLTGFGHVFDATDLTWQLSIGADFDHAIWNSSNIVTLIASDSSTTQVATYNGSGQFRGEVTVGGSPIGVFEYNSDVYVVIKDVVNGDIQFNLLSEL